MMPKFFYMIKNKEITKDQVIKDIIAIIIVAVIALPLSIALGISSGVSPEKGLITAIFAGKTMPGSMIALIVAIASVTILKLPVETIGSRFQDMSSIITIHISRIVHAITLLATMLILMPLAKMIPMTALVAILIVVSYNMSEWRAFKVLLKAPKSDVIVLLITFGCTVIFDLVVAISIGMIMAMFLFVKSVSDTTEIRDLVEEEVFDDELSAILEKAEGRIRVFQVNGPLFFGIVQEFIAKMKELESSVEVVILDMRHSHAIDASAIDALTRLLKHCNSLNIKLCLNHVQEQPMKVLDRMGFIVKVGESHIYETKTEAIGVAYDYLKCLEAS